ncbi:MAG: hypothetical protein AB1Z98_40330 [Nannocystaceae bacterium]
MRARSVERIALAWATASTLGLGLACGPQVSATDDAEGSSDASGDSSTVGTPTPPSTTGPVATTSSSGAETTSGTTTDADDDGYEDDDGGTGCTFTCPPPPPPPPMGGTCNCPPGEKCMPWAADGSMTWTNIRCSPIVDDPGQPGDACTVEGSQWSGIDDCDAGSMCFGVDPQTNVGTCASFCSWFGDGPCEADTECQIQPGDLALPVCVPTCDPTAPDCPMGTGCFAGGSSFTCQDTARMRAAVGSPCPDPVACTAGALCAYGLECGQGVGEGCCAEVCDLGQPSPCPPAQMCSPWFGGAGSPQWDHVGYCVP